MQESMESSMEQVYVITQINTDINTKKSNNDSHDLLKEHTKITGKKAL